MARHRVLAEPERMLAAIQHQPHTLHGRICDWNAEERLPEDCTATNCIWVACEQVNE
jgi:hypothetical protein